MKLMGDAQLVSFDTWPFPGCLRLSDATQAARHCSLQGRESWYISRPVLRAYQAVRVSVRPNNRLKPPSRGRSSAAWRRCSRTAA